MNGTETPIGTNVVLRDGRRIFLNRIPPAEVRRLKNDGEIVIFGGETKGGNIDVPITDIQEIMG